MLAASTLGKFPNFGSSLRPSPFLFGVMQGLFVFGKPHVHHVLKAANSTTS